MSKLIILLDIIGSIAILCLLLTLYKFLLRTPPGDPVDIHLITLASFLFLALGISHKIFKDFDI